ncbi:hypothetical protein [Bifidobacterium scaligerum]|nr:hypothetical protein [Bifidobacterium scaligerum]
MTMHNALQIIIINRITSIICIDMQPAKPTQAEGDHYGTEGAA